MHHKCNQCSFINLNIPVFFAENLLVSTLELFIMPKLRFLFAKRRPSLGAPIGFFWKLISRRAYELKIYVCTLPTFPFFSILFGINNYGDLCTSCANNNRAHVLVGGEH